MMTIRQTKSVLWLILLTSSLIAQAQQGLKWAFDGNSYYQIESGEIAAYTLPAGTKSTIVSQSDLTPKGQKALAPRAFYFSRDMNRVLIYTNTKKVWRLDTEGDYWIFDLKSKVLKKLGLSQPESSLRFAKFSNDGTKVAYVSNNDLFTENLLTGEISMATTNRSRKLINGTFDWVYEEEFSCRDGFQWSPDGTRIAFWQVDANKINDYLMINTTDSAYSHVVPVEYPTVGKSPSPAKIGMFNLVDKITQWIDIPGDPQQNYLPRMEWVSGRELLVQQLNRKQNKSKIYSCLVTGTSKVIYQEENNAWIDVNSPWENSYRLDFRHRIDWLAGGKEFLWASEKDGWRHLYRVSRADGKEVPVTTGNYDVMELKYIDEKNNAVYFIASPDNATQQYLYKTTLDGKGKPERLTPKDQEGTHDYNISPNGKYAFHTFSNSYTKPVDEFITLIDHKPVDEKSGIASKRSASQVEKTVEFFKIKTEDGTEMDGWVVKPKNFNPSKKYPVVFYVYSEPASQTVIDRYGVGRNRLFLGDMRDGYLYVSLDNRGTPSPKGAAWRQSIYRKIGQVNIRDQAMGAKEVLKWPYADASRVAVWGWSGGGSATLNLMFQYPDIYKTGISIAAVANQLTYDNIYQERYMGLPQENMKDFVDGSPLSYAKNLKGNLLYIHGTGDDNVHYNNAEMLVNELVKYNKSFQFMAYPNRSHSISEGEGTTQHLSALYTDYLKKYCPPGER